MREQVKEVTRKEQNKKEQRKERREASWRRCLLAVYALKKGVEQAIMVR